MTRRLAAAATAALFIFAALAAAPAPAGAAAAPTPAPAGGPSDLLVTFAYAATNGAPASDDGRVRRIAPLPGESIDAAAARWDAQAGVLAAIPDVRVAPADAPTDPLWSSQWDLAAVSATNLGSANAEPAWSLTTGSPDVVVAVLDTGRIDHPDLIDAMPEGWGVDMVSDPTSARDGDGRDADPTDLGYGENCYYPSSWHGTHVAGTIAAQRNGIGIAGIAPNVTLVHVRVLGNCGGGGLDDVADGIRWAAGLATNYYGAPWSRFGLPTNAHPADVINLSLGGNLGVGQTCEGSMPDLSEAIADARAAGTIVVAAAGNSTVDAGRFVPASCPGVISVAAVGRGGARASYSNYGASIDIAAPGGDNWRDGMVFSTVGTGARALTGYGYAAYQGTSMAAPHVVGVVALIRSAHPGWSAAQVEAALLAGVRPFPADTPALVADSRPCLAPGDPAATGGQLCGAGLLDAALALGLLDQEVQVDAPATLAIGATATVAASSSAGLPVTLGVDPGSAALCSLSGTSLTALAAGDCVVVADAAGDATHASARGSATVRIDALAQSIEVAVSAASALALTFGDAPRQITGFSSSAGLPLSYSSRTPATCTVSGDTLAPVAAGSCVIRIEQAGNSQYAPALLDHSLTIARAPQSIDFSLPSSMRVDQEPPGLNVRTSAGLLANLSSETSSVCRADWNGASFDFIVVGVGTCRIRASHPGDGNHLAATDRLLATAILPRVPLAQTNFQAFFGPDAPLPVGSRMGLGWGGGNTPAAPTFASLTPKVCAVNGTLVRALAAGTCTVRATKAGNAFYATATATMSRTVYEPARVVGNPAIRQSGNTVLGGSGSWSFGSPRAVLSFQWYRCGGYASSTCSPIAGATRANLSIAPDLRGAYVQLRVTATQLGGVARTTSQSGVLRLSSR